MKYSWLVIFLLINILSFLLLADKLSLVMYWYTMSRPDVYTYLTPYSYLFGITLIILVNIGVCFYFLIILINILLTSFYFKSSLYDQMSFLLKHPFCFPKIQGRCYHVSDALSRNGYIYKDINNKLYWDSLFKTCNVNTPNIIGLIDDSEIELYEENIPYKCIIKPLKLYSANGIQVFNIDTVPPNGKYIIQEYKNSFNNIPHSIRIVTIRSKDNNYHLWAINLSVNRNEDSLTTSIGDINVTDYEIRGDEARNVLFNVWKKHNLPEKHIKKAIADAIKLHKNMKYNLSSVGWDIIISQDGPYFLEGNMCHGIVRKKDIYYYEKIQEFIQKTYK